MVTIADHIIVCNRRTNVQETREQARMASMGKAEVSEEKPPPWKTSYIEHYGQRKGILIHYCSADSNPWVVQRCMRQEGNC